MTPKQRPRRKGSGRRIHRQRGGYVMVLVAMLLFGLTAMAALVIDIGFAKLAQRQMKTAADAAALEGLRYTSTDGRQRAANVVAWTFDDDFDVSSDPRNFGVGPIVNFGPGVVDQSLNASELMTVPNSPVYRPSGSNQLAFNPSDAIDGDMVEGEYAFEAPAGSTPDQRRQFHQENTDYIRSDFRTSNQTIPPDLETDPAFLVRIRRTGESFNSGIGTAGPTLPYLFGRGSALSRELIGNGIAVRATSIASLQPVVCVGEPDTTNGIPGKLGFAVPVSEWILGTGTTFFEYDSNAIGGDAINSASPPDSTGYLAIYDDFGGVRRVIGFGPASISSGTFTQSAPFQIPNASATFCYAFAGAAAVANDVFDRRRDNQDALFKLPVSAR